MTTLESLFDAIRHQNFWSVISGCHKHRQLDTER